MRIGSAILLGAGLLAVGITAPAAAVPKLCIADFPEHLRAVKIPLGCEIVDCCPGCPADGPLDWRVSIEGKSVTSATLRMGSGEPRQLPPGRTRLPSMAESARQEGPAPIATLELGFDRALIERWAREAGSGGAPAERDFIEVRVEQLLGETVVSDMRFAWNLVYCSKPEPCDRIVQTGNADGDESVILLDNRSSAGAGGCRDDAIARASGTQAYSNILANDGCPSDLSVYSRQNAVAFQKNASPWTDSCGDIATVDLDPLHKAPANFWIAIGDGASGDWWNQIASEWWGSATPLDVVQDDLLHAGQLYDQNKTGIAFAPAFEQISPEDWKTLANEVFTLPFFLKLILSGGLSSIVCALPGDLEQMGFYVAGELNVYYLPLPFTGMNCSDDPNVIFVGLLKKPTTLAHEFGHAFSLTPPLGHSNGVFGMHKANIMWVKETDPRFHFSLGQAFRMSLGKLSVLNTNGVRTGDTRPCPTDGDDEVCPHLGLDWPRP